uniref:2-phosphoxylose phosphatase 1 n=1 Tax=Lygus hesperus TaxID=30085 RepID=A0A0A9X1K8_LYGHE
MLQLMHRHGARAPEVSFNQSAICDDVPCGFLTKNGVKMILAVGDYVKNQYLADDAPKSLFKSSTYDLKNVYSRSTDVLRCLQSADAFLKGLFPTDNSLYPAIHTVDNNEDYLLNADFYPQFTYFYDFDKVRLRNSGDATVDKNFPNFADLTAIGKEVSCDKFCSVYETRSDCAVKLYEIATSKMADGTISKPEFKLLNDSFTKLS